MKRIMSTIVIIVILIMALYGCSLKIRRENRPCNQPNTKWISENGLVSFTIDANGSGTGIIVKDDMEVYFHIAIGPGNEIDLYPLENVEGNYVKGYYIEHWSGNFKYKNKFIATVENTTYFKSGDEIVFFRIDK